MGTSRFHKAVVRIHWHSIIFDFFQESRVEQSKGFSFFVLVQYSLVQINIFPWVLLHKNMVTSLKNIEGHDVKLLLSRSQLSLRDQGSGIWVLSGVISSLAFPVSVLVISSFAEGWTGILILDAANTGATSSALFPDTLRCLLGKTTSKHRHSMCSLRRAKDCSNHQDMDNRWNR